jgi:hypothetical protein
MTGVKTVTNTNFSHVDLQQFWASLSIVEGLMCPIKTFVCVKFRRDCAAAAVLTLLVFVCWQGADLRLRGVDLRIAAHPSEDYAPSSPSRQMIVDRGAARFLERRSEKSD